MHTITFALRTPVLIVDFGGVFAHATAKVVFQLGYRPILVSSRNARADMRRVAPATPVIVAACNLHVHPDLDPDVFHAGHPILGICHGHQLLAKAYGVNIEKLAQPEIGNVPLQRTRHPSTLFRNPSSTTTTAYMYHGYVVSRCPSGFSPTAYTAMTQIAAMEDDSRALYGVQFHPEDSRTQRGESLIESFLTHVVHSPPMPGIAIASRAVLKLATKVIVAGDRLQQLIGDADARRGPSSSSSRPPP